MAEKVAMAGTLELTPELRGSLGLRDREYVVKDPVEIVVETKDGDRLKPPQEIRERIVRCRDCANYIPAEDDDHDDGCALAYAYLFETRPDGFCAWGEEKTNE